MNNKEALEQIKHIRAMMEKAYEQIIFSPWQWIEWGILVIIGCLATMWLASHQQTSHLLLLWILIFIIGGALETLIWMKTAEKRGIEPFNPFVMKIWGIAGIIMVQAIVLTIVFGHLQMYQLIPGLWMTSFSGLFFILVIMGAKTEILMFAIVLAIGGILSLSILVNYSIILLMISFGVSCIAFGTYSVLNKRTMTIKSR